MATLATTRSKLRVAARPTGLERLLVLVSSFCRLVHGIGQNPQLPTNICAPPTLAPITFEIRSQESLVFELFDYHTASAHLSIRTVLSEQ